MADDDSDLARRLAAGDSAAAATFDALYRPRLSHICRANGVPAADVDDVVQEIFCSVYKSVSRFDARSALSTWLYTIAQRRIADYFRDRSKSGPERPGHGVADGRQLPRTIDVPGSDDPHLRLTIENALSRLPPRLAFVLSMHEREGLTTKQIAPLLSLSPGRTGALLADARRRFRQLLLGEECRPSRRLRK